MTKHFVLLASLVFVCTTALADWPQWRGPDQTGHTPPAMAVPERLPSELQVVWQSEVGPALASPVVADGRVFHLDAQDGRETLHAINAATAAPLWSATIDDTFSDGQGPSGPRSTPVVDGDRVYVQSCKGELQCLKVEDGTVLWRVNFTNDFGAVFTGETGRTPGAARHGNTGPPLPHGDWLIANVGGTNGASVVCFNKFNGEVIWKSQNDMAGYAPPVVATLAGVEQVISFTAEALIGLDLRDGQLLWRVPIRTAFGRHVTTPVVVGDMVVVSSHQAGLIGTRILKRDGKVTAEQAWLNREAAINFASPVAVGDFLYGVGSNRDFICIDVRTGELKWSQRGHFISSPDRAHAGFIVMGRNILALTDAGLLVLFEANPEEFREISRLQVCGVTWTNPAYSNGRLFLRDGLGESGNLLCIDLM